MHLPSPVPERWSLETWFTGFGEPDYVSFKEALVREVEVLKGELALVGSDVSAIAQMLVKLEDFGDRAGHFSAYLGCLSAADANNEKVCTEEAWATSLWAEAGKLQTALQSTLVGLSEAAFEDLLGQPELVGARHSVTCMRRAGQQQMSTELEGLAADLNVTGFHTWGRLYDTLTGKMVFPMTFPDGRVEAVPMERRRALMAEPDRRLRETAFHEGQKPWLEHADTLAAGLNAIAGTRLTLIKRRGIGHFLDTPLFDSAMSRASLDAMLEAIHRHIELPRRALRTAARLQGTSALHYFDLEAPQIKAPAEKPLSWDEACATVERTFSSAYPNLGGYFGGILEKGWVESQPRPGKRPGAFCTGSRLRHEERIYMTWNGTVHDMVTLAHEAGHAWHSNLLRTSRSYAANYPMTLAETASNFGEMILLSQLMEDPALSAESRAYLIDQEMLRAHAYLVNIPMRYEFEKAFYTERGDGEVPVSRLRELMEEAQRKIYGDTLLADGTDPMFWASKMHFFITGVSFYNFPYVFGYLLSLALFARFKAEGKAFLPHYEAFLAATGSATCEEVVKNTLGGDLTSPDFWAAAIRSIEPTVGLYEKLA